MIIPYGTDAPVYHWPYATIGTIAVNAAVFAVTFPMILLMEEREGLKAIVEFLILKFGTINPLQWLTWNYMHADPLHLIVNMAFLWSFGIIVEGKIGWWRFLTIYNAIGIMEGAVIQSVALLLNEGEGALGSSGAIFGLLAISMIWAPVNEMQCIYFLGRWFGTTEASVLTVAAFYIVLQIVIVAIHFSYAMSGAYIDEVSLITSEALHIVGAFGGLAVGIAMVSLKWVDCENFDVFSVLAGRHKMTDQEKREEFARSAEGQALRAQQLQQARDEFQQHLAQGQPLAALAAHRRAKHQFPEWALPEPEFVQLLALLNKLHFYDQAVPAMLEYLRTYQERIVPVRLALAQMLTNHLQRPRQALAVLGKVNGFPLDPSQQKAFQAIHAKAAASFEQDPYEVEPEDW